MGRFTKQATFTIPEGQEELIRYVKQEFFPDVSDAEMYRQLIKIGLIVRQADIPKKDQIYTTDFTKKRYKRLDKY